jgi:ABC-type branched-subunit amino acid transport system substrate-binding protein
VELLVDDAYDRGARRFVLLHTNDDFGEAGVDGMESAVARLGDVEMVDNVGYDATETNFAPLGRRIADADADAVIVWGVSGASQIMTVTQESGYEGLWMLNDVFRSGFFLSTLDAIPGLDSSNTFVVWEQLLPQDTDVAGIAEFSAAFTEAYPESDLTLGLLGWSAASLFVDGVRAATEGGTALTWPGLRAAFETFEAHDSGSAVGVTFTPDNHLGVRSARLLAYVGNSTLEVATDFAPLPGL